MGEAHLGHEAEHAGSEHKRAQHLTQHRYLEGHRQEEKGQGFSKCETAKGYGRDPCSHRNPPLLLHAPAAVTVPLLLLHTLLLLHAPAAVTVPLLLNALLLLHAPAADTVPLPLPKIAPAAARSCHPRCWAAQSAPAALPHRGDRGVREGDQANVPRQVCGRDRVRGGERAPRNLALHRRLQRHLNEQVGILVSALERLALQTKGVGGRVDQRRVQGGRVTGGAGSKWWTEECALC